MAYDTKRAYSYDDSGKLGLAKIRYKGTNRSSLLFDGDLPVGVAAMTIDNTVPL